MSPAEIYPKSARKEVEFMEMNNVFENLPVDLSQEVIERIASNPDVRIERIISRGHVTPEGFWYDQSETEWVILLQGTAEIQFEGEAFVRHLRSGDHLVIPPHQRHRVVQTSLTPVAIWLAVFY